MKVQLPLEGKAHSIPAEHVPIIARTRELADEEYAQAADLVLDRTEFRADTLRMGKWIERRRLIRKGQMHPLFIAREPHPYGRIAITPMTMLDRVCEQFLNNQMQFVA